MSNAENNSTANAVPGAILELVEGQDLSFEQAREAAAAIMHGEATDAQIGALLLGLRMKGETVDEIRGFVSAMRERALRIEAPVDAVDPCGTGGDGRGTFNVSTAVAFVAAAAGCPVAKHGNRSVSSRCGSTDFLEALGVDPSPEPELAAAQLAERGLCFLFAPRHHQATRHAAGPRREIGVRSIFNLVGPMTNPAGCRRQLLGVFAPRWTEPVAQVLLELGSVHCLVVHSEDGLDEISIAAPTRISELKDGRIDTWTLDPAEFGFSARSLDAILGGDPERNVEIVLDLFSGSAGPAREIVLLNAGATLYVGGRTPTIEAGIARAAAAIDDGSVSRLLERFRADRTGRSVDAQPA